MDIVIRRRSPDMDELLQRLRDFVVANPEKAIFNAPAAPEKVAALEAAIGLRLPKTHRQFLFAFNGGFINIAGKNSKGEDWDVGTARWNSHHLLDTQTIEKEYKQLAKLGSDVFGIKGKWKFVPFCQTKGQELLVFGPARFLGDSPILDAFHEYPPQ